MDTLQACRERIYHFCHQHLKKSDDELISLQWTIIFVAPKASLDITLLTCAQVAHLPCGYKRGEL